jgi:glutathione peroxidase
VNTPLLSIPVKTISGEPRTLGNYQGKVLLVVNVASKCGLTPQYAALEALYRRYKDRGFEILGFPANDFLGQEPGTDAEIADFCSVNFAVSFPMFSKIGIVGEAQHPLYRQLIKEQPQSQGDAEAFRKQLIGHGIEPNPAPGVLWNFEKFLIGRDGRVAARFAPSMTPEDPMLVQAVEAQLARR